jgi:hypothetical protein
LTLTRSTLSLLPFLNIDSRIPMLQARRRVPQRLATPTGAGLNSSSHPRVLRDQPPRIVPGMSQFYGLAPTRAHPTRAEMINAWIRQADDRASNGSSFFTRQIFKDDHG